MSQPPYLGMPLSWFLPDRDLYDSLEDRFRHFLHQEVIGKVAGLEESNTPSVSALVDALQSFSSLASPVVTSLFEDTWDITFGTRDQEPEGWIILSKSKPGDIHFYQYGSLENTVLPVMLKISEACGQHLILETGTLRCIFPDPILQKKFAAYEAQQVDGFCPVFE